MKVVRATLTLVTLAAVLAAPAEAQQFRQLDFRTYTACYQDTFVNQCFQLSAILSDRGDGDTGFGPRITRTLYGATQARFFSPDGFNYAVRENEGSTEYDYFTSLVYSGPKFATKLPEAITFGFSEHLCERGARFQPTCVINGQTVDNVVYKSVAINFLVTPEPASLALLGTGLLGVFGAAYRQRRRARS